ncbi:MAG: electron transport complex protein RnfC [Firmicutes bacterium]|nr:electron transport complex protein RnfC [Bacillota bacterium]
MTAEEIRKMVREAGVVGAGGAGFPTDVKLDAGVELIIVNGAECEPLLRVDQELMEKKTAALLKGLDYACQAVGTSRAVIALKGKYKKAIIKLKKNIKDYSNFSIHELPDFYPAGDEQQIVYEVTGKIIPEGGIPLAAGTVVINVETLINVNKAVAGLPVTHKYVTISGEVKKPVTVLVPVGTIIKDILPLAGGTTIEEYSLIDGGPMMGKLVVEGDVVQKTTKGILVLPRNHSIINNRTTLLTSLIRRAMSACCQCRACTDICPRYLLGHSLEPHKLMRAISYGIDTDSDLITQAVLCCECGACDTWGCPMGLSPRTINMQLKEELAKNNYKNTHNRSIEQTHSMREYRKIPVKRLIKRLGIADYDQSAPIIENDFNPEKIIIPMKQHIGAPAVPVVNLGNSITVGQLIASKPEDSLGANIHSGINGVVKMLGDSIIIER